MTVCRSAIAARAMLRTPGTIAHGTWSFPKISGCGLMRVRMRTCISVGVSSCPRPVPYAMIQRLKSITMTTASPCRYDGCVESAIWRCTRATELSTWNQS